MKLNNRDVSFTLSKRHKIIFTSIIFGIGFLFVAHIQNIIYGRYYPMLCIFTGVIYLLSLWSLQKEMTKLKAFMLFILPVAYCLIVPTAYLNLRETRWLSRFPLAIISAMFFYFLLLTQNVFNVASDRSIPLYRAASASNFLYTIILIALINTVIFSIKVNFPMIGLLILITNFFLILQCFWTVKMERITTQVLVYTTIATLIFCEFAITFTFWPVIPQLRSLFLIIVAYVILTTILDFMRERLNRRSLIENLSIGGGIFVVVLALSFFLT